MENKMWFNKSSAQLWELAWLDSEEKEASSKNKWNLSFPIVREKTLRDIGWVISKGADISFL